MLLQRDRSCSIWTGKDRVKMLQLPNNRHDNENTLRCAAAAAMRSRDFRMNTSMDVLPGRPEASDMHGLRGVGLEAELQ